MEVIHDQAGAGMRLDRGFPPFPVARLFQGSDDALWTQERGAAGGGDGAGAGGCPESLLNFMGRTAGSDERALARVRHQLLRCSRP